MIVNSCIDNKEYAVVESVICNDILLKVNVPLFALLRDFVQESQSASGNPLTSSSLYIIFGNNRNNRNETEWN
jgi:hypothetical protein